LRRRQPSEKSGTAKAAPAVSEVLIKLRRFIRIDLVLRFFQFRHLKDRADPDRFSTALACRIFCDGQSEENTAYLIFLNGGHARRTCSAVTHHKWSFRGLVKCQTNGFNGTA
jgi:hypothetical protein